MHVGEGECALLCTGACSARFHSCGRVHSRVQVRVREGSVVVVVLVVVVIVVVLVVVVVAVGIDLGIDRHAVDRRRTKPVSHLLVNAVLGLTLG